MMGCGTESVSFLSSSFFLFFLFIFLFSSCLSKHSISSLPNFLAPGPTSCHGSTRDRRVFLFCATESLFLEVAVGWISLGVALTLPSPSILTSHPSVPMSMVRGGEEKRGCSGKDQQRRGSTTFSGIANQFRPHEKRVRNRMKKGRKRKKGDCSPIPTPRYARRREGVGL
ncbi:hypothetical protein IE53DRAFT_131895 [Violaceomyces palustris]|uniref:Uncharacterized protein n=1 Tax=Violaceomyces palustris TaxID=1673888 RepID=A0ACD0NV39_9BASI|nr:hypothetical protein IE53DRAFT_131895 [Violaceomyces palustris]